MAIPLRIRKFNWMNADGEKVELYSLTRTGGTQSLLTEADVATEVEHSSSLTQGDVLHVMNAFMFELRKLLVRGDRVRIDGFGTFFMTVNSDSEESPDLLTTRSVRRVNIRFLPDRALRLVNNANVSTRSANNVSFEIRIEADDSASSELPETPDNGNGGGDDDDEYIDPDA